MRVAVSGSFSSLRAAGGWLLLTAAAVSAAQAQTPTLGTCIARYSVTTVWLSAPGIYQYGAFNGGYDAGNPGAVYTDPNFIAGRYADALSWAEIAMRMRPSFLLAPCTAAASGAFAGRLAEAEKAMAQLRRLEPELRISNLKDLFPTRRQEDFARWVEGLREAGLPE